MALLAAGSLQNIYASLDAYLTTKLVTEAGLALQLHGVRRFIPPTETPWVEVFYDFLGMQSQFRRQTGAYHNDRLVLATEQHGYLQCDIYQRARFWATRYTTAAARDAVVSALPESGIILVYDYASGQDHTSEEVGAIILDGKTEYVADQGLTSGIIQHVIQVRTRYLETYVQGG